MTFKSLLLAALLFSLAACNQATPTTADKAAVTESADIAALDKAFDDNWNKHDSAALANAMADDAIMLGGRYKLTGKKEIAGDWLHNNLPVTSNLKTTVLQKGAGSDIAYSAGTWSLDLNIPGQAKQTTTGNHTFVYKKQTDGSWKIALINIENHDPETNSTKK